MKLFSFSSNAALFLFRASIKTVCFLIGFFLLSANVNGQSKSGSFGLSVSSSISGVCFGTQYSPSLFVSSGRGMMEIGPIIQKRNANVSGGRVNFEYTVFDGSNVSNDEYANERLDLFFFADSRYHNSALLGKNAANFEQRINKESTLDYKSLRFKTIEGYAGFGLRIKLLANLKWTNSIGVGGWHTIEGEKKLEREHNGLSVFLRTSLVFKIK